MEYEKQTYYVSVAHRLIQESPNDSAEFEVLLDEEELSLLQDKLNALTAEDDYTFRRAPVPYKSADHDDAPEQFNKQLSELYVLLYRSGTAKTRTMLMESGILSRLGNTDYHHPGYGEHGSPLNK
ncbi:hypothetical protein [Paenibacillus brevis]|uniref:Hydrolase n=1 Tax=Paenibacillus brevis TaxID=2841508 RepID=A0ABS6FTE4_9BACL|nr:hypothetical protein [Paenibacillus brevis]MBU5673490.1 hypothetical protein [Paenibacillus brevis]